MRSLASQPFADTTWAPSDGRRWTRNRTKGSSAIRRARVGRDRRSSGGTDDSGVRGGHEENKAVGQD